MNVQTTPLNTASAPFPPLYHRRLFTTAEYHAMLQKNILREDDALELIKGEIVTMSPGNARHANCVRRLLSVFTIHFSQQALIDVQNPVQLDAHSEPQPDIVLLKLRDDLYATHPTPEDILLLVEVSDTSVNYDREVKCPLYARAGIQEFWIVNLVEQRLEVYTAPTHHGYGQQRWLWTEDEISPLAFPDIHLPVSEILD
ncbi:MAG: Uma2 family endonuclease [Anaerolineae bacterium]|nr:Uma2 family endonuclease [Anaerolineae bacterium]